LFIIVGLGNPGKDYTNTRHNVGFDTIDLLAKRNSININKIKFNSVYGEGTIGDEKVLLVKPQTYMNNSGITVRDIYNFYKVPIENVIVIVDDIDIQFSRVRIKAKGSAGSHNGLKSIIYLLGRDDFPRVKIGIGSKRENQDLANFVLSRFSKDEREVIESSILTAAESVETIVRYSLDKGMNEFNTKGTRAQD